MRKAEVTLLGGFAVSIGGVPVPPSSWARRHAAALVKLLALAPGHRLHREQVVDHLWPDDALDVASPKLHKAAHYARKLLGGEGMVVLRGEAVSLMPEADVVVDVEQ